MVIRLRVNVLLSYLEVAVLLELSNFSYIIGPIKIPELMCSVLKVIISFKIAA